MVHFGLVLGTANMGQRLAVLRWVFAASLLTLAASCAARAPTGSLSTDTRPLLRDAIRRVVVVGSLTERRHSDRLRAAADMAELVGTRTTPLQRADIATVMIEILAAEGGSSGKAPFRTADTYPVIQVACRISDAELLVGMFPHLSAAPDTSVGFVVREIMERGDLLRTGRSIGGGRRRVFSLVNEAIIWKRLANPLESESHRWLFLSTTQDLVAAFWTWEPFSKVPDAHAEDVGIRLEHLEYLGERLKRLKDESAAREARDLLVELSADKSWLIRAIVLAAMREDALYDPRAMALLEERAEPFQRETIESVKGTRAARGLPLDQTSSPSESRTMD